MALTVEVPEEVDAVGAGGFDAGNAWFGLLLVQPGVEGGEALFVVVEVGGGFGAVGVQQAGVEGELAHVDAQEWVVGEAWVHGV